MLTLNQIFVKLANDSSMWLPDFSDSNRPTNSRGKLIKDTTKGFSEYCIWLSGYLSTNTFQYADYQIEIIKRLRKRKELSNLYILANVGLSGYAFCNGIFEKYPQDFLSNPNPGRLKSKDLKKITTDFDSKNFKGFSSEENLQVGLVFEFISLQQNSLYNLIEGPKWLDIGWRALLKEAINPMKKSNERVKFVKTFIEEIAYLHSK